MAEQWQHILAQLDSPEAVRAFCEELFTAKELHDISLRWRLLEDLAQGDAQRTIAQRYHISLCKITRGARLLRDDNSVVKGYLQTQSQQKEEPSCGNSV